MKIYFSALNYFYSRVSELEHSVGRKAVVWAPENANAYILATNKANISENGIILSSKPLGVEYREKELPVIKYSINPNIPTLNEFIGKIHNSTLDEIYLLVGIARPELVNIKSIQTAINVRLVDLKQSHDLDVIENAQNDVNLVFQKMSNAEKNSHNSYFQGRNKVEISK